MGGNSSAGSNSSSSNSNSTSNGGLGPSANGLAAAIGGLGGYGNSNNPGNAAEGVNGYSVGADGTVTGPNGFDTPGFSLSRSNPANARSSSGNAVADALALNEAMRQVGAIPGDQYAENRENIFSGEVGKLNGLLASSLRDAYSPRMTGLKDMFKNMFTTPDKVDTPYTALNSLISSGYAEPTPEGFKATPKAALGMFSGVVDAAPFGIAKGVMTGDPLAAVPTPLGVLRSLPGAIGLANQMQVAGITPAQASGTNGDSVDSRGGANGVFNADTQYAASLNSPLVSSYSIDPVAWFARRRGLLS